MVICGRRMSRFHLRKGVKNEKTIDISFIQFKRHTITVVIVSGLFNHKSGRLYNPSPNHFQVCK